MFEFDEGVPLHFLGESVMTSYFDAFDGVEEQGQDRQGDSSIRDSWRVFTLDRGEETQITWLNADDENIPVIQGHFVWFEGTTVNEGKEQDRKGYYFVPSLQPLTAKTGVQDKLFEFYESLEDGSQLKSILEPRLFWFYSILSHRDEDQDWRTVRAPYRKAITGKKGLCGDVLDIHSLRDTVRDAKKGLYKNFTGLQYATTTIKRPDEKMAARIGEVGSVVDKIDPADYGNPVAFTPDEIIKRFFIYDDMDENGNVIDQSYPNTNKVYDFVITDKSKDVGKGTGSQAIEINV
jgi:hypothetical protein